MTTRMHRAPSKILTALPELSASDGESAVLLTARPSHGDPLVVVLNEERRRSSRRHRRSTLEYPAPDAGSDPSATVLNLLQAEKQRNMMYAMRLAAVQDRAERRESRFKREIQELSSRVADLEQTSQQACEALHQQNLGLRAQTEVLGRSIREARTPQRPVVTPAFAECEPGTSRSRRQLSDAHVDSWRRESSEVLCSAACEARRNMLQNRCDELGDTVAGLRTRIRRLQEKRSAGRADVACGPDAPDGGEIQEPDEDDLVRLLSETQFDCASEPESAGETMAERMRREEEKLRSIIELSKQLLSAQACADDLEKTMPKAQWDAITTQIEAQVMRKLGVKQDTFYTDYTATTDRSTACRESLSTAGAQPTPEQQRRDSELSPPPGTPGAPHPIVHSAAWFAPVGRSATAACRAQTDTSTGTEPARESPGETVHLRHELQCASLLADERTERARITSRAAVASLGLAAEMMSRAAQRPAPRPVSRPRTPPPDPLHRCHRMQTASGSGDPSRRDQYCQTPSLWRPAASGQEKQQPSHGQMVAMARQLGTSQPAKLHGSPSQPRLQGSPQPAPPPRQSPVWSASPQSSQQRSPPLPVAPTGQHSPQLSGARLCASPSGGLAGLGRQLTGPHPTPPAQPPSSTASPSRRHSGRRSRKQGSPPPQNPKHTEDSVPQQSAPGSPRRKRQSGRWQLAQQAGTERDGGEQHSGSEHSSCGRQGTVESLPPISRGRQDTEQSLPSRSAFGSTLVAPDNFWDL
eukprot:TRINITY_DN10030_c0_g1_i1.p1 TRINITY_DN10030_c0_g1~~TRINITY_DN10030_c0_g1_i1.p1  ORF type:complete len:782 (+),score=155.19 TRINITY_DN10030_c0_g1_i1:89-2347(+)